MYKITHRISPIDLPANSTQAEEFLDMVAGIQGSRMNDQRADLPEFPGLHNSEAVIGQFITNRNREDSHLDDGFYEMLMRCQVRFESHRIYAFCAGIQEFCFNLCIFRLNIYILIFKLIFIVHNYTLRNVRVIQIEQMVTESPTVTFTSAEVLL